LIISAGATGARRRQPLRIGVVAVLAALAAVGFAGPAAAHDVLISSDPADGSTVQVAPQTVTLTFDQPVQDFEPVVTVTGPDGQSYQSGSPTVDSTVVTNAVSPLTAAGEYAIAYRVVSADGHPVTGEVKFQFTGAPAPAASSAASTPTAGPTSAASGGTSSVGQSSTVPVSTAAVAPTSSSSGLSGWVWAALALAAVLIIAAVVVVLRRPRESG